MTHKYIGTKIITAWPDTKDGKDGYGVIYEAALAERRKKQYGQILEELFPED